MSLPEVIVVRAALRLDPARPVPSAESVRAAFGARHPSDPLLTQHGPDGLRYRTPLVHYSVRRGVPVVVGFGDAAQRLLDLDLAGEPLRLGGTPRTVIDVRATALRGRVGLTDQLRHYRFASPWLPFSQENWRRFQALARPEQRRELDRIAIGNLLSLCKGLGCWLDGRLLAAVTPRRQVRVAYKGIDRAGFVGELVANLELPPEAAVGRAVSVGYGRLVRAAA